MSDFHHETVRCPQCGSIELFEVQHIHPKWVYNGSCSKCSLPITEENWDSTGHLWNKDMMSVLFRMKSNNKNLVIITDPPYGVRQSDKETDFDWDDEKDFIRNIQPWLSECLRVTEHTVIWHCAGSMLPYIFSDKHLRETYMRLHFWEKPPGSQYNGASNNNTWYNTEPILVFSKDKERTKANYDKDIPFAYDNMSYPTVAKKKYGHPTTKPLGEIIELVLHYTLPEDTVLDPFAGSMTLAEACIKTGRKYICIEKDESNYQRGLKRIAGLNTEPDFFSSIVKPTKKFRKDANQQSMELEGD